MYIHMWLNVFRFVGNQLVHTSTHKNLTAVDRLHLHGVVVLTCICSCLDYSVGSVENYISDVYGSDIDVRAGPTLGVAVTAWVFGTADAIVTLVLLRRATTDQDGPFRTCMPSTGGASAGAPAGASARQPGVAVVGTV